MRPRWLLAAVALMMGMALLVASGCGQKAATTPTVPEKTSPSTAPAGASSVKIENRAFSPGSLTVTAGTKVTWTNADATPHTVTSDTNVFESGTLQDGGTFSFTFDSPGTYPYHCAIHPDMVATITVTAGTSGLSTTPTAPPTTAVPPPTSASPSPSPTPGY